MGFLKKVGKALKKAAKKVGKGYGEVLGTAAGLVSNVPIIGGAASAALSINSSLIQGKGSQAFKQIPGGLAQVASVFGAGGGLTASYVPTPFTSANTIGGAFSSGAQGLLQSGFETLKCSLFGDCGPATPTPAQVSAGFQTLSGPAPSTLIGDGPLTQGQKQAFLLGGLALVAWLVLRRKG